jgi:hypothetical protein
MQLSEMFNQFCSDVPDFVTIFFERSSLGCDPGQVCGRPGETRPHGPHVATLVVEEKRFVVAEFPPTPFTAMNRASLLHFCHCICVKLHSSQQVGEKTNSLARAQKARSA